MNSPGVMAFGSAVGMVVSWVSHVLPAGSVIIRCVESWACRQLGTPDGAIGAGWTTAGDKPPRYIFPSPHPSGFRRKPE